MHIQVGGVDLLRLARVARQVADGVVTVVGDLLVTAQGGVRPRDDDGGRREYDGLQTDRGHDGRHRFGRWGKHE